MLKVGDTVFGGMLVIVEISPDYRVFKVTSLYLGDPQTNSPAVITFGAGETVDQIRAFFGVV